MSEQHLRPDGEPDAPRDPSSITGPLEALLFMASEPMSTAELAQALDVPKPVVWDALDQLRTFYDETNRGFELREVGQGWRYYTRPEHHGVIAAWILEGQHGRLSQAALETLAVVAYLQPIARSRVSAIRGVNVDGVMRTLVTRELIEETERDPESGAMRFKTTDYFLERMGLASLDQLPPIAPHLPEASALEAELRGLAEGDNLATLRDHATEEAPMTQTPDSAAPAPDGPEVPPADQLKQWADEQVAGSEAKRAPEAEAAGIPDEDDRDRLSVSE